MPKFIQKKTKKTAALVKEELESTTIKITDGLSPPQDMLASEALMLGTRFMEQRNSQAALIIADQLYEYFPHIIDMWLLKLRALIGLERLAEANRFSDKLLGKAPTNVGVLTHVARLKLVLDDATEALRLLSKANQIRPNSKRILLQLGICHAQIGEDKKALGIYKQIWKLNQANSQLNERSRLLQSIDVLVKIGELDSWEPKIKAKAEALLTDPDVQLGIKSRLALGLSIDAKKSGDIEREMQLLDAGNQHMKQDLHELGRGWSKEHAENITATNMALFDQPTPKFLQNLNSHRQEKPIFILAMPRSGTTLQEQMLGSHSQIGQTGESRGLPAAISHAYENAGIINGMQNYPQRLEEIPLNKTKKIAADYIEHQRLLTNENCFVDKELSHYRYVGLATHLFPEARFIHMSRHPLDIFLSCYRGGIPGLPATCSMEDMAYHYMEMKKLIAYWKKLYPDRVHIIEYAELVEAPEEIMRETLDFLALEWEDNVLQFHKRKNVVRTLSLHQVRKGIYKTSVKKWLPYKAMMEPAIQVLTEHGMLEMD